VASKKEKSRVDLTYLPGRRIDTPGLELKAEIARRCGRRNGRLDFGPPGKGARKPFLLIYG
jgi:hypothetical protein